MATQLKTLIFTAALIYANTCGGETVYHELYTPQSANYTVYDGENGGFGYNDYPSIEFFEDKFVAAWQANAENVAEVSGRRLYLSTSKNLISWTAPVDFLVREAINPSVPSVIADEKQGRPFLYNNKNKALWCIWCIDGLTSEKTNAGIHLSVLNAGAKLWSTTKIFEGAEFNDKKFYAVPTQKPIELRSGKFLLPIKLCTKTDNDGKLLSLPGFLYSIDGGKQWQLGGTASMPENSTMQCDSSVIQQKDGKIRVFSIADYRTNLPPSQRLLTTTGTGTELEDELKFEQDMRPAAMDSASGSLAALMLSTKRYALVAADVYSEITGESLCYNPAIFFSRTGTNDFVGGYPFAMGASIAHPQLLEKDGNLYIIYTKNPSADKPSAIALTWVEMPKAEKNYIFGRSKDVIRAFDVSYTRSKNSGFFKRIRDYRQFMPATGEADSRKVIIFESGAGAGIDVEPVDVSRDESVQIAMKIQVPMLQDTGELTLFCVGDTYPVRVVMPAGRSGDIYVSAPGVYRKISQTTAKQWFTLSVTYSNNKIVCKINDDPPAEILMQGNLATQRFHIGNNCMNDAWQTNEGSLFYVDAQSISTASQLKPKFSEY